jgi:hypothetical protein
MDKRDLEILMEEIVQRQMLILENKLKKNIEELYTYIESVRNELYSSTQGDSLIKEYLQRVLDDKSPEGFKLLTSLLIVIYFFIHFQLEIYYTIIYKYTQFDSQE